MQNQAPSTPIVRFAMTMLGVRDLDASIEFYTERLGLRQTGRIADLVFLDAGGNTICLSAEKRPPGEAPLNLPVELVLAVDSVGRAYEYFTARRIAFVSAPHPIGGSNHVAHFRDPDGHLFSLFGPV